MGGVRHMQDKLENLDDDFAAIQNIVKRTTINKDEDAPIFTVSDYGLVEDLFKAVPEIEKKIN